MVQAEIFTMSHDQWSIVNDSISRSPFLLFDAFLFVGRDDDLMLPAAATTVVTTPVLQNRKYDARRSHDALIRRSSQLHNLDVLCDLSIHKIAVAGIALCRLLHRQISLSCWLVDEFLQVKAPRVFPGSRVVQPSEQP